MLVSKLFKSKQLLPTKEKAFRTAQNKAKLLVDCPQGHLLKLWLLKKRRRKTSYR